VVEDVPQVRATAVRIMEDLGCEVFDAYNGQQTLKLLQAHPEIEVLFADVRMPGMSATELAEAAQRLRPDLKIVLTSGYVGPKDVPADIPFVPKPWRVNALAEVVWDAALWPNLVLLSAAISEIMRAARRPVIHSWVSSNLPGPDRRSFIRAGAVDRSPSPRSRQSHKRRNRWSAPHRSRHLWS